MKWKWCEMCRFDGHCENQDRNMECACYAREQTLRAEQYANLIDKQQKQLEWKKEDVQLLIKKLLSVKPELEEWIKLNFGEYL